MGNKQKTMQKISVIVPVFNGKKYLHECVDSILAQTLNNSSLKFEIKAKQFYAASQRVL